MIIQDVVSLAKYSELSGVSVKNDINAIVAFMNLGMLELYKRFPVKVEEHMVALVDNTAYYKMPDSFMYALEAHKEVPANSVNVPTEIAINESDVEDSIFFTSWDTIQVPAAVTGTNLSIIYVSKPTTITVAQAEDGVTVLDLPDTLVDALLSYVGYRAYLGVRSDAQSENNAHWVRFRRNCDRARELGVAYPNESMRMSGRIASRGFV